jgi:flagellar hook-associated protein 2
VSDLGLSVSDLGLSGLASGVDTSGIVDKLMEVERAKATPITYKKGKVTAQQTALKDVAAKLAALSSAAADLKKSAATWNTSQAVASSDPSRLGVAKISGAGIGGHSIQVDRLASSAQRGFSIGDLTAGGSLTVNGKTFTIAAGATPASVVDQINAASDSPVYAALVNDAQGQQRLVLSARSTGESSRFTASGTGFTEDPLYESAAGTLNAKYRVDGDTTARESTTNVIDDAVAGLRLTLKGVTSSPVSVTVAAPDIDRDAVKTKVKAVVDAYNAVVTAARAKLDEKPVVNPSNATDAAKGSLFGDTGLESMLSGLRNGLRETLSGLTGVDDLGDIGIGVPSGSGGASSQDAKDGKFTVDDAKLTDALAGDWTKVASFLDAFAGKVDALVKVQTGTTNSLIDGRVASDDRQLKDLSAQMDALNLRLTAEQDRYKAQFAAMEIALQNAQSQQQWMAGQLSSLNSG